MSPGKSGKIAKAVFLSGLFYLWYGFAFQGIAQHVQRINSGTRSDILYLTLFTDSTGFLASDKLHQFENGLWKHLNNIEHTKVSLFYASSLNDYWVTVNNESSNSEIFHWVNNTRFVVPSPFANEVTAIHSITPDTVLFASFSSVACWTTQGFNMVTMLPGSFNIVKLHRTSGNEFWALTREGKLFHYTGSEIRQALQKETVKDFFFGPATSVFLCENAVYRLNGNVLEPVISDQRLQSMLKIAVTAPGTIWMAGIGRVYSLTENRWQLQAKIPGQSYRGIFINGSEETWIYGDHGMLLYSGNRKPEPYDSLEPGFTGHKILEFGVKADGEYGVALTDLNGDGKEEIYTVRIYNPNRLYINSMDESQGIYPEAGFREEAMPRRASGISNPLDYSTPSELFLGVAAADVDNDGDQDLYLCSLNSRNKLLLNDGTGYFRDVSYQNNRACENLNRSNAASFADVDLDGDLDLFVTCENGSNRLFTNDGTGHFTDATKQAALTTREGGMCSAFSDFNQDGLPDLAVSFWNATPRLYINKTSDGNIRFADITRETPLAGCKPSNKNAVVFSDVNNDGWPDLLITGRNSANKLYINNGKGAFSDCSAQYLGDSIMLSNGAVFADMNLDGYPDLFLANVGLNVFYENQHGKYFRMATAEYGMDAGGYSTGCAVSDIDNDGDIDLYVSNYINENSLLYINRIDGKRSVTFQLMGVRSNRDAIGAKIWFYAKSRITGGDSLAGYREITCGEGYGSVNSKRVLFAADPSYAYTAVVKFPSTADTIRISEIRPGKTIEIVEITGMHEPLIRAEKFVLRLITDREMLMEIARYCLILMLFAAYLWATRKGFQKIRTIRRVAILSLMVVFIIINQLFMFHQSRVMFYVAPVGTVLGLFLIHLITERFILKRMTEQEKVHIREKIARDLHDDLASTLGTISIYADSLSSVKSPSPEYIGKLSEKISDLTHSAKQSITDIIWMTSPRNDSLQGLIVKITSLMAETFNEAGVKFSQEIRMSDTTEFLNEGMRNNLFLILKEATNNILKHSGATEVEFTIIKTEKRTLITLRDNGTGFDRHFYEGKTLQGHGISNMYRRAAESSIVIEIKSENQSGTSIHLEF